MTGKLLLVRLDTVLSVHLDILNRVVSKRPPTICFVTNRVSSTIPIKDGRYSEGFAENAIFWAELCVVHTYSKVCSLVL